MTTLRSLALTLLTGLLVAGCAEPIPVNHEAIGQPFFTRVRLRSDGPKLFSSNYVNNQGGFPPGSKAEITMFSAIRVDMKINNIPHQMVPIGGDFNTAGIDDFCRKYFVTSLADLGLDEKGQPLPDASAAGADGEIDPLSFVVGAFERSIRSGIDSGMASIGMTKAQVLMALGPPAEVNFGTSALQLPLETILDANRWVYYTNPITPWWFQRVYVFDGAKLIQVEQ